jgi:hypothetical protein
MDFFNLKWESLTPEQQKGFTTLSRISWVAFYHPSDSWKQKGQSRNGRIYGQWLSFGMFGAILGNTSVYASILEPTHRNFRCSEILSGRKCANFVLEIGAMFPTREYHT